MSRPCAAAVLVAPLDVVRKDSRWRPHSTVAQTEMREGIAKIISLAGVREAMKASGIEAVSIGDRYKNGQTGVESQLAGSA